jgi:hypothetical protein
MTATTFKERYANHTSSFRHKKRLKQNGTFGTYLEIKRKQSGFYHQMFNFKTRYFRTQGDQNAVIYVWKKNFAF